MSYGPAPSLPTAATATEYNSYVEDPKWQRRFSIIWATTAGVAIALSLPHFVRSLKNGRVFRGFFGVLQDNHGNTYSSINPATEKPQTTKRRLTAILETISSFFWWSVPVVGLSLGQLLLIAGYLVCIVICITMHAPLIDNPNRAGFMVLAQFPVVYLFATKNSILSLLLGPGNGYERLNFLHRWAGRGMLLAGLVHGSLWIRNHLLYDIAIIGQQKETSGVAALGTLCGIFLTSWRPVRQYCYQFFFVTHILGYVAFTITVCYHTIYAYPWIYAPLALYGLDVLFRMFRYRIKDATLVPVDGNMTLIHVHDCTKGWQPGQFVRLRVFFSGRVFESHPLTILNAPSPISCIPSQTLTLAARVKGDWTSVLNGYAAAEQERLFKSQCAKRKGDADQQSIGVPIHVMLDGPYGGCGVDLGQYESALLIAGGSGATFTLSLLDDIVARCVKLGRQGGEKTRRIEFVWCIRSYGCIEWFASILMDLAAAVAGSSLDLHISMYVTCLCNPEKVPVIPNSDVSILRPSVHALMHDFVTPPIDVDEDASGNSLKGKLNWVGLGGGVAICAAGPETLTTQTRNAAAKLSLTRGIELGGVGLHTEVFAI